MCVVSYIKSLGIEHTVESEQRQTERFALFSKAKQMLNTLVIP